MEEAPAPLRRLNERTEKHYCVKCLSEVPAEEYFRNDFVCDKCVEEEQKEGQRDEG